MLAHPYALLDVALSRIVRCLCVLVSFAAGVEWSYSIAVILAGWRLAGSIGEGGIRTHGDQESSIDGLRSGFLLQRTIAVLTAKMRFGIDSLVCWKGVS